MVNLDNTAPINNDDITPMADLSDARLYGADLFGADLDLIYLTDGNAMPDLTDANLSGADL